MALQREDCRAVKERWVPGQSLCIALQLSMIQIPAPGRDMALGLDTGLKYDPVPGRNVGLDIGWDWCYLRGMGKDPDMNWG